MSLTGHAGVAQLRRTGWVRPKLGVIPVECRVGPCQLMIICPYPFCSASWKCCPVLVQVALKLRRCEAQCLDVR